MSTVPPVNVQLPGALVEQLSAAASSMGMDLATYLAFLQHARRQSLDTAEQEAVKFMFSTQSDSLRKLAR